MEDLRPDRSRLQTDPHHETVVCDELRRHAMNRQSRPQFRPTELPAMNWRAKRAIIIRAANYQFFLNICEIC